MKTFIQLKDGIGFAYVTTNGETDGIEITGENPDYFINKKYENEEWVDAPVIWYAIVNSKGKIVEIKNTVFPSIVGSNPIIDEDINPESIWNGSEFVLPVTE
jgi:hypothetical protein